MRTIVTTLTLLATLSCFGSTALADQDSIGDPTAPIVAVAGHPIDMKFPNHVLPPPSRKVLQFVGNAEAFGPTGTTAILGIHFDYTDPNTGAEVIVPTPNFYQQAIQVGAGSRHIEAGPYTIPFCPEEVSIHFENLTPNTEILFEGLYDHTCVPVPEPATLSLVMLCGVASLGWRRIR